MSAYVPEIWKVKLPKSKIVLIHTNNALFLQKNIFLAQYLPSFKTQIQGKNFFSTKKTDFKLKWGGYRVVASWDAMYCVCEISPILSHRLGSREG